MTDRDNLTLTFNGDALRVVFRHGSPWFSAADLCRILNVYVERGKPRTALCYNRVSPEDRVSALLPTTIGPRMGVLVTERGLYAIANEADADKARAFRDWIVDDALPTIRSTYAAGRTATPLSPDDLALMSDASALIARLGARVGQAPMALSAN